MFKFIDQLMQLIEDRGWTLHGKDERGEFSYSVQFSVPSKKHEVKYLVTILISVNGVIMSLSSGIDASPWFGLEPLLKDLFVSHKGMIQGRTNGKFSFNAVIEIGPSTEDVIEFVDTATRSADWLLNAIKAAEKAVADVRKQRLGQ